MLHNSIFHWSANTDFELWPFAVDTLSEWGGLCRIQSCAMLLNSIFQWSANTDFELWPYAVDYAVSFEVTFQKFFSYGSY